MQKDYASVWDRCLHTIRQRVNEQSFKTWFEPIKPIKLEGSALTVQVPNNFFYEWLEEHYISNLKESIRQELGPRATLKYQIRMDANAAGNGARNGNGRPVVGDDQVSPAVSELTRRTVIQNPFAIPGVKRPAMESDLNKNYTFDKYIEGDCNRLARSAGEAVANKPGGTAFNPLFLFGAVGLGKTHLAQAIGNSIEDGPFQRTVRYMTTEKFTNDIIYAIKNGVVGDLVNLYQNVDVLIVDDIQFLANRQKTQEIFFHIFNQLHQTGKQIILTSDRAPKDLPGIEERLISRFKWGLSADLQAPDLETRIAIMESKLAEADIDVHRNVVEYICFNIQNNIRELEGVAASLIAHFQLNRRDIDIALAQEVIQNFVRNASHEITIDKIKKYVADHYDIPIDRMKSKTRKREVVVARQTAMYLCKTMTAQSLKTIGDEFGGRDHSTVIYSCKAVQDLIDTDPPYRETVTELQKQINMSMS